MRDVVEPVSDLPRGGVERDHLSDADVAATHT